MPVLSNARHERFAQELAKGQSISGAYHAAGYENSPQSASRLLKNAHVSARVSELKADIAAALPVTQASICAELEEARSLAMRIEQPAPAVSASMGKAKVAGLLVDRTEVKAEVVHDATPRELARAVLAIIRDGQRDAGKEIDHADAT